MRQQILHGCKGYIKDMQALTFAECWFKMRACKQQLETCWLLLFNMKLTIVFVLSLWKYQFRIFIKIAFIYGRRLNHENIIIDTDADTHTFTRGFTHNVLNYGGRFLVPLSQCYRRSPNANCASLLPTEQFWFLFDKRHSGQSATTILPTQASPPIHYWVTFLLSLSLFPWLVHQIVPESSQLKPLPPIIGSGSNGREHSPHFISKLANCWMLQQSTQLSIVDC